MRLGGPGPGGVIVRILTSLLLVYATYNPEGVSFFHWAILPLIQGQGIGSIGPIKVVAGILLLIGWLVFLQATRRSIGVLGSLLVLALGAALIWLLIDWHVLSPRSARALVHLGLIVISLVLAAGLSWSSYNRRITGQVDTDQVG